MGFTIDEEQKIVRFFKDKEDTIIDAVLNIFPFRSHSPNYVESMSLSKWNSMPTSERNEYREKYDYEPRETHNC